MKGHQGQDLASNAIKKVTFLVNVPMPMREMIEDLLAEKIITCQETDKMEMTTFTINEMEVSWSEVASFTILSPAITFSSQVVVKISSTSQKWTQIKTITRKI